MNNLFLLLNVFPILLVFSILGTVYVVWKYERKADKRKSENQRILRKLHSLRLNLQVHPDNEPNSEFEDRIDDLDYIINTIKNQK